MQRARSVAFLFALILAGCATKRAEFLPSGADHAELASVIATQGRGSIPEAQIEAPPPSFAECGTPGRNTGGSADAWPTTGECLQAVGRLAKIDYEEESPPSYPGLAGLIVVMGKALTRTR
jgi:hypothetical protein